MSLGGSGSAGHPWITLGEEEQPLSSAAKTIPIVFSARIGSLQSLFKVFGLLLDCRRLGFSKAGNLGSGFLLRCGVAALEFSDFFTSVQPSCCETSECNSQHSERILNRSWNPGP